MIMVRHLSRAAKCAYAAGQNYVEAASLEAIKWLFLSNSLEATSEITFIVRQFAGNLWSGNLPVILSSGNSILRQF